MRTKTLSISLLSISFLLAACGSINSLPATETTSADTDQEQAETAPENDSGFSWLVGQSRADAQGAVTVTVTGKNVAAGMDVIEFDVALETHSVDLNMDLAALSTLATDAGLSVNGLVWDGPLGGHHVSGTLSFPATVNGNPVLDGANRLTLTILNVDAPERIFTWQR